MINVPPGWFARSAHMTHIRIAGLPSESLAKMLSYQHIRKNTDPIKKWAAFVAMAGSVLYDIATGSRVGTERALFMTLIVLSAVIMDRRALTMRNLAFAVLAVVAIEPEAILGVSFQLSFAAVVALVAVMESRIAALDLDPDPFVPKRDAPRKPGFVGAHLVEKPLALLVATAFATSATASFMAYHFMMSFVGACRRVPVIGIGCDINSLNAPKPTVGACL